MAVVWVSIFTVSADSEGSACLEGQWFSVVAFPVLKVHITIVVVDHVPVCVKIWNE